MSRRRAVVYAHLLRLQLCAFELRGMTNVQCLVDDCFEEERAFATRFRSLRSSDSQKDNVTRVNSCTKHIINHKDTLKIQTTNVHNTEVTFTTRTKNQTQKRRRVMNVQCKVSNRVCFSSTPPIRWVSLAAEALAVTRLQLNAKRKRSRRGRLLHLRISTWSHGNGR